MRYIGMDVHRGFCEVAILEGGEMRSAPRVITEPDALEAFAEQLGPEDHVALENTGVAEAIARVLEPHVARVVVSNPKATKAIAGAKAKTDYRDARTLASLLAAGFLPEVWLGDPDTRVLRRRIARRGQLVRARTRAKNEAHACLHRTLKGRPPMTDAFGVKGRGWLAEQDLPDDERESMDASLRQVEFFDRELDLLDGAIARQVLHRTEVRRLMTIPGVDLVTAASFIAAVGDISRFPTSRHLVGYLGLDPRVRQSGDAPARHGRISKEGSSSARHVLVEAAWVAARAPGPLRAFAERIRARRGSNVAAVAVARKLAVLAWHMLSQGEDYAFARPTLVRAKLRRLELRAGAAPRPGTRGARTWPTAGDRGRDAEVALQAEMAYRRLVKDWRSSGKGGAGAATGARIS
jgi:transposase